MSDGTVLTDSTVRFFALSMIHAETERDRQTQIGASSFSNPCDRCLAAEFAGQDRFSEHAERPFLGRDLGTLIHAGLEDRQSIAQQMFPGVQMEQRVVCALIPGYGEIPGHFDVQPTEHHIIDWKGSLRWRIALLEDVLQAKGRHRVDSAPRWVKQKDTKAYIGGRKFDADERTTISLSNTAYLAEMEQMEHKYRWYYGQQQLYMGAVGAKRASLVFIARDGTGYFDNPEFSGYDNPDVKHDVFVLSFDFNAAYHSALISRGTHIWQTLSAGEGIATFDSHPSCHYCTTEAESNAHTDAPNIEYAAFGEEANITATRAALVAA